MYGFKASVIVLLALTLLLNVVCAAGMEKHVAMQKRAGQDCDKCAQSYVDCFFRFGISGCTDPNAEHFTYCRNCYGVDPSW